MLIACWSPKGGSGTTVTACSLAAVLARSAPSSAHGVLLADLAGDVPAVLGLAEAAGPGLAEWLAAGPDVAGSALRRLEVEVVPGLRLLPWAPAGSVTVPPAAPAGAGRAEALLQALSDEPRPVVVDCGAAATGAGLALAAGAPVSLLVLRPCYLALRRALRAPVRPSGVVLLTEPGRSLGRRDIEDVLGVPVRAEVAVDETVARAVDAGLLVRRIPRGLERALRAAVGMGAGRDAA
jgi:Mrp family chromosome partitioning ATPase